MKKATISNFILLVTLSILFLLILAMKMYFPLYLDDWQYLYVFGENQPINGLLDIIRSEYRHFFLWGGRVIVHAIAQFILYVGRPWGDILNTIVYISLLLIMMRISGLSNKIDLFCILLIHCMLWFFLPSLGENLFWIVGSANYMWGGFIWISFIYYYCKYYIICDNSSDNLLKSILFLLYGIIAGWTNENMSVALIFFLIVLFFLIKKEKRPIPRWAIYGFIGSFIGALLLICAPGNYVRYELSPQEKQDFLMHLFYRSVSTTKQFSWYASYPATIYVLMFILYQWKGNKKEKKNIRLSLLLFLSSLVATYSMIMAPIFPTRAWFGIIMLMIIAIMILYTNLNLGKMHVVISCLLTFIVLSLFIVSYIRGLDNLISVRAIFDEREMYVEDQKSQGIEDVVIYGKFPTNQDFISLPQISDIPLDSTNYISWIGKSYSRYLGVKSIAIVDTTMSQNVKRR